MDFALQLCRELLRLFLLRETEYHDARNLGLSRRVRWSGARQHTAGSDARPTPHGR